MSPSRSTKESQYSIDGDIISRDNLEAKLEEAMAKQEDKVLYVKVDKDVPTGQTVEIIGMAKKKIGKSCWAQTRKTRRNLLRPWHSLRTSPPPSDGLIETTGCAQPRLPHFFFGILVWCSFLAIEQSEVTKAADEVEYVSVGMADQSEDEEAGGNPKTTESKNQEGAQSEEKFEAETTPSDKLEEKVETQCKRTNVSTEETVEERSQSQSACI